ncbi:hypothetical protein TVAGG3_0409290 [Trichomonas vaginalis G3]|uniref:hypothetical protein n=1 Tax=Trichomonas vaginalis (strain ATCC PRA-98 / G3) TaxID=412133 RepID=UPI0021E626FC|nr:hypothetical protein TVAGG3_0409290 [Trichomonas vaginalis G3]KAI5535239.1 hypothetical protein TVAGG3_0409290 [Trichomonas vaginalis G3]
MGICCTKDDYDPASNFENVVVAQMAKEAAEKLANQPPYATDPLLNNPDKLEFENVDFSNSSAEYDREELDALLKSDSEDPIQAPEVKTTEAKIN